MLPTEHMGVLFDIQRMSIQDGPGIRTSLFFKGCPLRCAWCHNPESYERGSQLRFLAARCVSCGACRDVCPSGVHQFAPAHRLARERCTVCGRCVDVCCYDALSVVGREYGVEELLSVVEGDRPYFERRDALGRRGGLTLTGGEPMAQFPFVRELVSRVRDMDICMETSGYAPLEQYEQLLPYIHMFLWDWKASDPDKHRRLCGKDNRLIRDNLDALYEMGAQIVLRLPLIPGVNDDLEHLLAVAAWLRKHPNVREAQIMAYHHMGVDKTAQLGMQKQPVDQPAADAAKKAEWLSIFHREGASCVTLG